MKHLLLSLALMAAVMGFSACDQLSVIDEAEEGSITFSLGGMAANIETKASSTTAETYESQVNNVQVFIFNGSGAFIKYGRANANSVTITKVPAGTYTVAAVVNCSTDLSATASLSALKATAVTLGDNSTTAATGFRMYGEKSSVTVAAGSNSESIDVYRLPARVTLVSITNGVTGGAKTVVAKAAILINGRGSWQLSAAESATTVEVNPAGRKSGTIITTAANATYADLTFADLGSTSCAAGGTAFGNRFYSFPKAEVTPDKYGTETGGNVRLSVLATVNGTDYWYPVTINGVEKNKAYDVRLTITGAGSDDPNTPPVSGSLTATVSVKDWVAGTEYTETI